MGGLTDLGGITPHPTPTPTRVSEFLETVNNWLGGGVLFKYQPAHPPPSVGSSSPALMPQARSQTTRHSLCHSVSAGPRSSASCRTLGLPHVAPSLGDCE